jgi:omega-amidase
MNNLKLFESFLICFFPKEIFNCPIEPKKFREHAEPVPDGETSQALSKAAIDNKVYIIGGSIPELDELLYNTCAVFSPSGEMIAKHRKIHMFDIDIPGKITFKESNVKSPGNRLTTFETGRMNNKLKVLNF